MLTWKKQKTFKSLIKTLTSIFYWMPAIRLSPICTFQHSADNTVSNMSKYTVFRKKTPTHIFFHISVNYLCDLNKNCSEYTQRLTDSGNVKIRYSLRSMT